MWKKSEKGYFLVELLLSLSALLIAAGVVFPLIIGAMNRTTSMKQEYEAKKLLYETFMTAIKEEEFPYAGRMVIQGNSYEIIIEGSDMNGGAEICVVYEGQKSETVKLCDTFK